MKRITSVKTESVVSNYPINAVIGNKIPLSVRILGKHYKVEPMPEHTMDGEFGACNYAFQLIEYNSKLAVDECKDTILHEMVHALDHGMQLKLTEEQVHAVATGFYSIIKDNKEFFEWVMSDADI